MQVVTIVCHVFVSTGGCCGRLRPTAHHSGRSALSVWALCNNVFGSFEYVGCRANLPSVALSSLPTTARACPCDCAGFRQLRGERHAFLRGAREGACCPAA